MLIQKFVYEIIKSNAFKEIALEEIKSIYMSFFKHHEKNIKITKFNDNIIIIDAPIYIGLEIARRAALIKWSGIIIDNENAELIKNLHFKRFKSVPNTMRLDAPIDEINKYLYFIRRTISIDPALINLRDPFYKFKIMRIKDKDTLVMEIDTGRFKITKRNPFFRPFAPPATMDSITSRILVNLSRVSIGDIFLDPFAGTGSLLIESYFIGAVPIGIEIHPKHAFGAKFNAKSIGAEINILIGDATKCPFPDNHIDAIATDPPYGRSASTFKKKIIDLYTEFLKESYRILKPKRYLAMFYPAYLADLSKYAEQIGFIEIFKKKIRVHKDLSRYLTVFFKP